MRSSPAMLDTWHSYVPAWISATLLMTKDPFWANSMCTNWPGGGVVRADGAPSSPVSTFPGIALPLPSRSIPIPSQIQRRSGGGCAVAGHRISSQSLSLATRERICWGESDQITHFWWSMIILHKVHFNKNILYSTESPNPLFVKGALDWIIRLLDHPRLIVLFCQNSQCPRPLR